MSGDPIDGLVRALRLNGDGRARSLILRGVNLNPGQDYEGRDVP